MNDYTFTAPGKPKPKGRPRFSRRGGTYTPKETVEYERRLSEFYRGPLFDGPVEVEIDYFSDEQIITVRSADARSSIRADLDNLVKATLDALTIGGAWVDDRQVVRIVTSKN